MLEWIKRVFGARAPSPPLYTRPTLLPTSPLPTTLVVGKPATPATPATPMQAAHEAFVDSFSSATKVAAGVPVHAIGDPLPPVSNWQHASRVTLKAEGGYVNHPRDRGKCTNMGITIGTLRAWRNDDLLTCADVKALTEMQAREIYRAQYWNPIQGDDLPAGLGLVVYDHGVTAGVRRAAMMLQTVLGMREVDGVVGPKTRRVAWGSQDYDTLIRHYSEARRAYYRGLADFDVFGKGWLARVNHVEGEALAWSKETNARLGRFVR